VHRGAAFSIGRAPFRAVQAHGAWDAADSKNHAGVGTEFVSPGPESPWRVGLSLLGGCLATVAAWRSHFRWGSVQVFRSQHSLLPMNLTAFSSRRSSRAQLKAAPDTGTEQSTNVDLSDEDKLERFRALCTTLLREVGKREERIMEFTHSAGGSLGKTEFSQLLEQLEIPCEGGDAEDLFSMLDEDKSGKISISELKTKLRSSGVITQMYEDGVNNALLTLIPTVVAGLGFAYYKGPSAGFDFATAYIVEDSLSVDNLFVFLIIFKYFKVPPALQKKCLDLGIYGAVILRALFIYAGIAAVNSFKPVLLVFAVILLYASFAALTASEEDEEEEEEEPPEVIKDIVEGFPTSKDFEGDKLFTTNDAGSLVATPLALCIISIELSDILFAVDSVPAAFAVTEDPLIIFTSNIAAIAGLRSLYQILSIAVQDLVYLEKSAAIILGFVGLKLVLEVAGYEISSAISLGVIVFTLGAGISLSLLKEQEEPGFTKAKKKNTVGKIVDAASNAANNFFSE